MLRTRHRWLGSKVVVTASHFALGCGLLSVASSARAEADAAKDTPAVPKGELPTTGFEYGLRVGLELPVGDIDGGASVLGGAIETRSGELGGVSSFGVPIALDIGYRTSEHWWWGALAGAGTGPVGGDCPDDASCEWASLRLGAQTMYFWQPPSGERIPWLGLVLGYESLRGSVTQSITVSGNTASIKAREYLGGPFLTLQGGLDFSVGEHLRLGPYASGIVGSYLLDEYECPDALGCPDHSSVDEPKVHAWFGLGVRGSNGP